jgi:hypothetical protein
MSHLVEITPTQTLGWQGVAEALAASGVESTLVETSPGLRLALGKGSAGEVAHALESWLVERGSQLLPQVVDDGLIVLRPPAA